jgi:hypothetical protein
MAYAVSNPIKLTAGGPGNSVRIWSYTDGDAWATIDASGYFNLEAARLKVGDVIHGVANGVAGTVKVVSNDGTTVDTSNAPANVDSD